MSVVPESPPVSGPAPGLAPGPAPGPAPLPGQPPDFPPDRYAGMVAGRHRRQRRLLLASILIVATAAGFGAWFGRSGTPSRVGTTTANLTLTAIEDKVEPAIVNVVSTLGYLNGTTAGTGMVLTSSGEILTNNHVIAGAVSIAVTDVGNGKTYTATVTGFDRADDVAVLQLSGGSGLKTVSLGDSDELAVGQAVVALGNAEGLGGEPAISAGLVTALDQSITATDESGGFSEELSGLIETSAALEVGYSGGPLVDMAGEVVGINTAASDGFDFQEGSGKSYAIPINQAVAIASRIRARQPSATVHIGGTAFFGVQIASGAEFAAAGAAVIGVVAGSPASTAGLAAGDVITSFAGHPVTAPASLTTLMDQRHPGDKVRITWRDPSGQAHSATVTLVTGPAG